MPKTVSTCWTQIGRASCRKECRSLCDWSSDVCSSDLEWKARADILKDVEVDMANLARSLTQHAEDSLDLLDASILGAVGRLETDGVGPEVLPKLQKVLVARKVALQRIHGLVI